MGNPSGTETAAALLHHLLRRAGIRQPVAFCQVVQQGIQIVALLNVRLQLGSKFNATVFAPRQALQGAGA